MKRYSIWVLEYGFTSTFPRGIALHGAFNETIRFSYGYVLIKGNGVVAMVDVGFDNIAYGKELNDRFGVESKKSSSADSAPVDLHDANASPISRADFSMWT